MKTMVISRLSAGSLFKILFIGMTVTLVLFGTVVGILEVTGISVGNITLNNEEITGLKALALAPISGFFIALVYTISTWLSTMVGILIYSRFKKMEIAIKE